MSNQTEAPTWLDLYDYRRRVAAMYAERAQAAADGEDEEGTLARFRARKDALYAHHPQSPIPPGERAAFVGLRYFPYDPAMRVTAQMEPAPTAPGTPEEDRADHAGEMPLRRAATVTFALPGVELSLAVYWIDVYGGGLFLPFRDATCPAESYGGGRYLFDTVKGSDFLTAGPGGPNEASMGYGGGRVVLDFNYAYNPSCAYDPRWVCPLAPAGNHLSVEIRAGERKYRD